jgi:hypothetical protein
MKTYYIVKHVYAENGITEYQFSDDIPGKRTFSYDYNSIEEGMLELQPANFIMVNEKEQKTDIGLDNFYF